MVRQVYIFLVLIRLFIFYSSHVKFKYKLFIVLKMNKSDPSKDLFEFLRNANKDDYTIVSNDDDYSGMTDHSIVCNQNISIDKSSQNGMYNIVYICLIKIRHFLVIILKLLLKLIYIII